MDCVLPATGGTTPWVAVIGALALLFAGVFLFALGRRRKKRGATFALVPLLVGALLLTYAPAPSATAADDCSQATRPATTATPLPSTSPSPSASTEDGDVTTDTDRDGLPDSVERRFGSDPALKDTDGDGLTDVEEAIVTTDPTSPDTDGDGVADPLDDLDEDGLSNRRELSLTTQPYNPDTDGDALRDGDEVSRGVDPARADTDGDGVQDGDEVRVGSDPLVSDADQAFTLTLQAEDVPAALEATGTPAALAATTVERAPEAAFENVAGLVGTPTVVDAGEGISEGTLTLTFDAATVPAGAELAVMHLNEETGQYDQPADQSIDAAAGTATVTTSEFSPFIVVDLNQFNEIWKNEVVVPREGSGQTQWLNSVLAIDSSGSMSSNDPADLRKDAAKIFVDSLLEQDKAAVIDFDDYARLLQGLTTDRAAVRTAIDRIDSSGGTNIGSAVRGALDELDGDADTTRGRIIVLLTDGDGSYDGTLTDRAISSGTTVYTVGLGSATNAALLDDIATRTGGEFFLVENADGLADAYERIGGDLGKPDADGDGLADEAETNGWRTQRGNVYKTDPNKADTDGDGLTDGEEAGHLISTRIGYSGISSPLARDTDGDGLDDLTEVVEGTSPLSRDTDADGLDDFAELEFGSSPNSRNADGDNWNDRAEFDRRSDPLSYDLTGAEGAAALAGGVVFGDWEWGAENIGRLNAAQRESVPYLLGQLGSGFVAVGDIRDALANAARGDWAAAGLSLVGVVPLLGDGARTATTIATFSSKGPRAAQAALSVSLNLARSDADKLNAIRRTLKSNPASFRVELDLAVRGSTPPRVLEFSRPISRTPAQNLAKDRILADLDARGYTDIRVNQQQVGASGTRLGINRPDIQATAPDGRRVYIELDTSSSNRGPDHAKRLLANDFNSDVYLLREPYTLSLPN